MILPSGHIPSAGDRFRCSRPECGCEMRVARASRLERGLAAPRCCCGATMQAEPSPAATAIEGEARVG